jgi:hypothetical protein
MQVHLEKFLHICYGCLNQFLAFYLCIMQDGKGQGNVYHCTLTSLLDATLTGVYCLGVRLHRAESGKKYAKYGSGYSVHCTTLCLAGDNNNHCYHCFYSATWKYI